MNYSKGRKVYIVASAVLVLAVAAIIFYLSDQTAKESAGTSGSVLDIIFSLFGKTLNQEFIRTFAHFCEYAGFGFLVHNLLFSIKDELKPIPAILVSLGYAITDEIHQIFVPGRAFQLIDLTVDLGGIVLGAVVFSIFFILNHKAKILKCK